MLTLLLFRLQFHVADTRKIDYPGGTYDVIFTRDTLFYVEDKKKILQDFYASFDSFLFSCDFHSIPIVVNITYLKYRRYLRFTESPRLKRVDHYLMSVGPNWLKANKSETDLEVTSFVGL